MQYQSHKRARVTSITGPEAQLSRHTQVQPTHWCHSTCGMSTSDFTLVVQHLSRLKGSIVLKGSTVLDLVRGFHFLCIYFQFVVYVAHTAKDQVIILYQCKEGGRGEVEQYNWMRRQCAGNYHSSS